MTLNSYDFKGNLLDKARNVITESALLAPFNPPPPNWVVTPFRVDWSSTELSFLNTATTYETTTNYDALNRVKNVQYPLDVDGSRKLLVPKYNRAGALENVQMDGSTYVERIAYNAKGQRTLISYGNGYMTRYAYDPYTFRLLRMRTEKYATPLPSPTTYQPSSPLSPLQDFGYEYDLAGNILTIHERTPGSGVQNTPLGPDALDRDFIYDPIYRLVSATGRECKDIPSPRPWSDDPRCGFIRPGVPNQGNAPAMTAIYTEDYAYDPAGNMTSLVHTTNGSRWTRSFGMGGFTPDQWNQQWPQHLNSPAEWLNPPGNQLTNVGDDSPDTSQTHIYDSNGNMTAETTSRHFEWDETDRLRVFRVQLLNAPPSIYAQHLYASSGQRVMKLMRDQSGGYETTIYIDDLFEHHRSVTANSTVENNSLHVVDKQRRVALVRVGTAFPNDRAPGVKYHFGDHLGSSNLVVDDTGVFINREEYLAYGEASFGSFGRKRYRFTGNERDADSDLYYHGARYYAPWLGRWTSCDPAGAIDGINIYLYARQNPILNRDPNGKASGDDKPQVQVNASAGKETEEDIGKLVESKGNETMAEQAVSKSGKGGSRHDRLIRKPGTAGSERSQEYKNLDAGADKYRMKGGELREAGVRARMKGDLVQYQKHTQALKDALQKDAGTFGRTSRSGALQPMKELTIYRVKNATPPELDAIKGVAAEVRPGIGVIGTKVPKPPNNAGFVDLGALSRLRELPVPSGGTLVFFGGLYVQIQQDTPHWFESHYDVDSADLEYIALSATHGLGLSSKEPVKPPDLNPANYDPIFNPITALQKLSNIVISGAY